MDIDLRLPSEEHDREEEESNGGPHFQLLEIEEEDKHHSGDGDGDGDGDTAADDMDNQNLATEIENGHGNGNGGDVIVAEGARLEPLSGMEFESLAGAYAFYQEYARSTGFNTAIQNSRRSKTTREFIDAKFACSRYGTKREYEKSATRPRSRQPGNSRQDSENATGRRSCAKTDCKASMHVKRRADDKWIIHRFEKDHNHELLPAQAVSEETRKMYAAMARQFAEYKNLVDLNSNTRSPFEKSRLSPIDAAEANSLLDFFTHMQTLNSNFFYAVDIGEDQRIRTFFWADAKSRHDYLNFSDVVSLETTCVRNKHKIPLVLFGGVNQHCQFTLLGCALVSDESEATYAWVTRTWLKAMGGQAPKIILTDQDQVLKSVVSEVLPSSFHYFFLWQVMEKVTEAFKQNESLLAKVDKCIHRSWVEEEFEKRWLKLVDRFELKENELMQSLYEDRTKWVPLFMGDAFFAGMSSANRSEIVTGYLDKFLHKKTSVQEFIRQYDVILQYRYEEEGKADSDTWNKQPALKSPSPFEKHVANIYTHAVFKKFQVEVLGAVACIPKRERQDEMTTTFRVEDFEKNQDFVVTLNELKSEVSCLCHLFEYKGYLCRHALIVLQICGISTIPTQYILRRWSRDAKNRYSVDEGSEQLQSRVERYNELCQRAMKLGEEGSLSQESYNLALTALDGALRNCISLNNSSKNHAEAGTSAILCVEDDDQRSAGKANKAAKKANPTKKRKVTSESDDVMTVGSSDSLQQMDKLSARPINFEGCFGPQQGVPGMVQLNLMAPTRDNMYANQQSIQGLGQLNTIAPSQDGFYGSQQAIHGLGQMDFFRNANYAAYGMREEANVRSSQLHEEPSRHT